MSEAYQYIGAFKPRVRINSFSTSIYKKGNQYYIDSVLENKIKDFFEINLSDIPILLKEGTETNYVYKGGSPIYSFISEEGVNEDGKLQYGNFMGIKQILLPLLNDNSLGSTAKLMISSFLKKHSATEKYLEQTQELLNNKGINFTITETFPSNAVEIYKIDELKKYEKFLLKHDPDNVVEYFVFRKGKNVLEKGQNNNSEKIFLYFKNKKISMDNIENIVQDEKSNSWLLKFFGYNYDAPNFHRQINNNKIIYNELLNTNRGVLDENCLIRAISPTIRNNPQYLNDIKANQSIWHLNRIIEENLTSEFNSSNNEEILNDNSVDISSLVNFDDFLAIPDKINPLL